MNAERIAGAWCHINGWDYRQLAGTAESSEQQKCRSDKPTAQVIAIVGLFAIHAKRQDFQILTESSRFIFRGTMSAQNVITNPIFEAISAWIIAVEWSDWPKDIHCRHQLSHNTLLIKNEIQMWWRSFKKKLRGHQRY